jgi:serine/threonine protein phosphatase 1
MVTHAGIPDSKDAFDPQNKDGVVWHRNEIVKLKQLQIYGHTPKQDAIYNAAFHAINIDTGAYKCNKLTAVMVDKTGEIQDLINEQTHANDLPVKTEECMI